MSDISSIDYSIFENLDVLNHENTPLQVPSTVVSDPTEHSLTLPTRTTANQRRQRRRNVLAGNQVVLRQRCSNHIYEGGS